MRLAPLLAVGLLLAGCMHGRAPSVVATVAPPPTPGSFRIAGSGADDVAGATVAAALQGHGWRPAAEGEPAAYLVLASYADRPAPVGALVPGSADTPPEWVAERIPRRPWTVFKRGRRAVDIVLLEASTGRQVRGARATLDYWRGADAEAAQRLADAAVDALTATTPDGGR